MTKTQAADAALEGVWVGPFSSPDLGTGQTTLILSLDEQGQPQGTWQSVLADGTVLAGSVTGGSITGTTLAVELDSDVNRCTWRFIAQQDGDSLSGDYSRTRNVAACDPNGNWDLTRQ